jgi:hypothetical protein
MFLVVRVAFELIFDNGPLARLRPMGARGVRNAHSCAEQAESDQKSYQELRVDVIQVTTDHWCSWVESFFNSMAFFLVLPWRCSLPPVLQAW